MGEVINGVINGVAVGVNDVIAALAPFGIGLTLVLILLALLFLGASYMSGATGFVAPLIRFLGISTGTVKSQSSLAIHHLRRVLDPAASTGERR